MVQDVFRSLPVQVCLAFDVYRDGLSGHEINSYGIIVMYCVRNLPCTIRDSVNKVH